MPLTVDALRNLYQALGGDAEKVADIALIPDLINAIAELKTPAVTVAADGQDQSVFEVAVSSIQSADTAVANGEITGTLSYLSSGPLADYWGAGNFIALKFTASDWDAYDSVMVGLDPSVSSGLADIKSDAEHVCVAKITDKASQKFVVEITIGTLKFRNVYDLSKLVLNES